MTDTIAIGSIFRLAAGIQPSFKNTLQAFKDSHPELPWYSPHGSSFVIASPIARNKIAGSAMSDGWWSSAQNSGLMEIYNHSADHDHDTITSKTWEPALGAYLAIGGYYDGNWAGTANFQRTANYTAADLEVRAAAQYIMSKIGVWPDLFLCPYTYCPPYLTNTYFPAFQHEHKTYGVFTRGPGYVQRGVTNVWAIPRFMRGSDYSTAQQLKDHILSGTGQ